MYKCVNNKNIQYIAIQYYTHTSFMLSWCLLFHKQFADTITIQHKYRKHGYYAMSCMYLLQIVKTCCFVGF